MVTRSAEWGHWGITFVSWEGPEQPYLVNIHGQHFFPCSSMGPCDWDRKKYQDMIGAWRDNGTLPASLNLTHATVVA